MKVLVAGASGFIGGHLISGLLQEKHVVTVLSRKDVKLRGTSTVTWDDPQLPNVISKHDAVINLCGEPIIGKRWSAKQKQLLETSRTETTRRLVNMINSQSSNKKITYIQASAIGYYGTSGDNFLDEVSPAGKDFLAKLCNRWESETRRVKPHVRRVTVRIGVVLGNDGGAFPKMSAPFKWFVGGRLGSGKQWLSWIHIKDLVGIFVSVLGNSEFKGIVNAVAPEPLTNKVFSRLLARQMRRPNLFPAPSLALKLLLGESSMLLLEGQRVLPKRVKKLGYSFRYPVLESALQDLVPA